MEFVAHRIIGPVLDRPETGYFLGHSDQGVEGVGVIHGDGILKGDERQVGGVGDGLEMRQDHQDELYDVLTVHCNDGNDEVYFFHTYLEV